MKSREFYRLFNKLLSQLLIPHGFTNSGSKKATFHRQTDGEVYHIIVPWRVGRGGQWFDIKVLATSPLVDLSFSKSFPDNLGMPHDRLTGLELHGMVNSANHVFRGNKPEGLIRNFNNQAKPAIVEHAIPYLDKIQTLKDLRSNINPAGKSMSYGLCLWHTGEKRKAKKILLAVKKDAQANLSQYLSIETVPQRDQSNHDLSVEHHKSVIGYIDELLLR